MELVNIISYGIFMFKIFKTEDGLRILLYIDGAEETGLLFKAKFETEEEAEEYIFNHVEEVEKVFK